MKYIAWKSFLWGQMRKEYTSRKIQKRTRLPDKVSQYAKLNTHLSWNMCHFSCAPLRFLWVHLSHITHNDKCKNLIITKVMAAFLYEDFECADKYNMFFFILYIVDNFSEQRTNIFLKNWIWHTLLIAVKLTMCVDI